MTLFSFSSGQNGGMLPGFFGFVAPTMLIFAIVNPLGWLLSSLGLVVRGLKIALVIAPLMIASYLIGLPYGPEGVAFAYSAVMMLWVIPIIAWCVHRTMISFLGCPACCKPPLASIIPAAALASVWRTYLAMVFLTCRGSSWSARYSSWPTSRCSFSSPDRRIFT